MKKNCNSCLYMDWNKDFEIDRENGEETYIGICLIAQMKVDDEEEIENSFNGCAVWESSKKEELK